MVGIRFVSFWETPIFRGDLLVSGRVFQAENVSNQFSKMKKTPLRQLTRLNRLVAKKVFKKV